ncbi:MAG TPA: MaoC family dehydratase N-terminal domain-containing protein [Acidimicrobiales bacterium]|nr:MaoC family dehydratase N-terminal domain-containing protein [Acidimicrobiales bacterium]
MADTSYIGHTGKPFPVVVERGKIHEFAKATKSKNPAYFTEQPVVPATYLTLATNFWEGLAGGGVDVGLNWARVLHGEQEFVYHGALPKAGDTLTGTTKVENIFTKSGNRGGDLTFVVTATELRNDAGELVAEVRTTLIETGKAAGGSN